MSRLPAVFGRRLLPITLSQLVGLACGVAGVKLNSLLVPPDDYGRYGIFLTFTPLGAWVVHAGLVKFTARHWAGAADQAGRWRQIRRAAVLRLPWLAAAAGLAALALAGRAWLHLAPFVFLAAAALAFAAIAQTALQADRRHWNDFLLTVGGSTTRTFLPPLFYWVGGGLMVALYAGFTLHALFFAGLALGLLLRGPRQSPVQPGAPAGLTSVYAGPMFNLLALAGWLLLGLNRWLVALFFGATTTGLFTLANNIAIIVPAMLGTMLTQFFQPDFFAAPHATREERRHLAGRVDRVALCFWLLALGGLGLLRLAMPWLTGPLIDLKYAGATGFILPAGCFFVATITGQFYHQLMLACQCESACGPVDLTFAGLMTAVGLASAWGGATAFSTWLLVTPVVPWLLNRPLARHLVLRPGAGMRSA